MVDFALVKSSKLISPKFWVIENLCNFHTVCLDSRDFYLLRPSILLIFYRSNLTQITNSLLLTLANQNISQFRHKKSKSWHHCQKFRQINNFVLPFNNASWVISTSPPVLYLEDPWLFFCFFFKDLLAKGSIRSTTVPNVDIFDGKLSLWFHVKNSSCFFKSAQKSLFLDF